LRENAYLLRGPTSHTEFDIAGGGERGTGNADPGIAERICNTRDVARTGNLREHSPVR